ncbi:hypothetical protein [Rhizobium leguminosarum]|uniref:hypothetical protein n=1 Tax=Rhizobium leguminosarum TaxID=384 RepID=UPI0010320088|nr:hypothetical protein [Rhizobium leguminosarum]TAY71259.1 hypothetical protein ELH83_35255 [Rhizobium leguminosarum]TAY71506.1 hypothetical protein ELH83_33355 [Rhizobium leguminosarum]
MLKVSAVALAICFCTAGQLYAASCEAIISRQVTQAILGENPRAGLETYLTKKLSKPRYFEDGKCTGPAKDLKLYPGVPYHDCSYENGGLHGWARVAIIHPAMLAGWIDNACRSRGPKCIAGVTAYSWCSNQLSFPIAANIIEASGAGGGNDAGSHNFIFLHGITVPRPAWIGATQDLDAAVQAKNLAPLSDVEEPTALTSQVARPAGIRREIYSEFAPEPKLTNIGTSCPITDRNPVWFDAARKSLLDAWGKPQNIMFDALAKALEDGKSPGKVSCSP